MSTNYVGPKYSTGDGMTVTSQVGEQLGTLITERRDFYISPSVTKELWKNEAPFITDVVQNGSEMVKDPDFKTFEYRAGWVKQEFLINDATLTVNYDTYVPGDIATAAAIDNGKGIPVTGGTPLKNMVVEIWDTTRTTYKGVSLCVAAVAGGAHTFRSLGNPRSATNLHAALADNDVCVIIGTAFGEASTAPDAFHDDIEVVYNSTQIMRTTVNISGTLYANSSLRGGYSSELARLRTNKMREHKIQKNKTMLRGMRPYGTGMTALGSQNFTDAHTKHVTDADGKIVRTTMGVVPAIYRYGVASGEFQNIFSIIKANYSYAQLNRDSEKLFQFEGAGTVARAYCGMGAMTFWNSLSEDAGFWAKSGFKIRLSDWNQDKIGINVKYLELPHGIIELVYEPAFRDMYANTMLVINPSNVSHKVYRPTKFFNNIKTEDNYDGQKDEYFSDEGMGLNLIETASIWTLS